MMLPPRWSQMCVNKNEIDIQVKYKTHVQLVSSDGDKMPTGEQWTLELSPQSAVHMRGTCALSLLVNPHIVLCVSPAHSEAS